LTNQRIASVRARRPDLDGNLIGGAADTPAPHFEMRRERLDTLLEDVHGIAPGFHTNRLQRAVNDLFGD